MFCSPSKPYTLNPQTQILNLKPLKPKPPTLDLLSGGHPHHRAQESFGFGKARWCGVQGFRVQGFRDLRCRGFRGLPDD